MVNVTGKVKQLLAAKTDSGSITPDGRHIKYTRRRMIARA